MTNYATFTRFNLEFCGLLEVNFLDTIWNIMILLHQQEKNLKQITGNHKPLKDNSSDSSKSFSSKGYQNEIRNQNQLLPES